MKRQERINIFLNRLKDSNLRLESEYINARTKVTLKCLVCGNTFKKVPYLIKVEEVPCPECLNRIPSSRLASKDEINLRLSKTKPDFHIVGDFKGGMNNPCMVHHDVCGKTFKSTPATIIRYKSPKGCSYCSNVHKYSDDEIKDYIRNHAKGYTFVKSFYKKHHLTITVIHDSCGYMYDVTFNVFTRPHRCPKCSKSVLKSPEEFKNEFKALAGNEYSLLSNYHNSHSYILVRHNVCGMIYNVSSTAFLSGTRCPRCNYSHGETMISNVLDSLNVEYSCQKRFPDCMNVLTLPFDFYIDSIKVAIEYDGAQHFKSVDFFGGESAYKLRCKRDRIKNKYCIENNIKLYRIPYTLTFEQVKSVIEYIVTSNLKADKFLVKE